ncbi:MAG: hypothetical protein NTW87_12540 [Planctomycetota bacterium]|nr:hypothetical protein [Planctomycetota bacterium]
MASRCTAEVAMHCADGKATGSGTRAMYPMESAVYMATSRSLREMFECAEGSDKLWRELFPQS